MFRVNFCNGCLVQINCSENKTYKIVISVNDKVVFEKLTSDKITKFGESDTNYFIDYKVDIYLYEVLVFSEKNKSKR
jgi:hypothetical protein